MMILRILFAALVIAFAAHIHQTKHQTNNEGDAFAHAMQDANQHASFDNPAMDSYIRSLKHKSKPIKAASVDKLKPISVAPCPTKEKKKIASPSKHKKKNHKHHSSHGKHKHHSSHSHSHSHGKNFPHHGSLHLTGPPHCP